MAEFYSVEATWRHGGQLVLTHVRQFDDRQAAIIAGRRLVARRRAVRVLRVVGDQTTGWTPALVEAFSADPVSDR
jgi:hypothetical protein